MAVNTLENTPMNSNGIDGIEVRLDWSEVWFGVNAGVMRRLHALRTGKLAAYGAQDDSAWDNDINGALAELGCAKWRNVFWSGTVGSTTLPDVGKWQVRSKILESHRLVVHQDEDDDEVFVLALVKIPIITLCGWLHGRDAKRPEFLKHYPPKPPTYFVENSCLRPMAEVPR